MKIINKARGAGKTTELVKIASRDNLYILVSDKIRVRNVVGVANKLDIKIPFPITVDELLNSHYMAGTRIEELLIDELDDVLFALTRKNIKYATITED